MKQIVALAACAVSLLFSSCSSAEENKSSQKPPTHTQKPDYSSGSLHFSDLRATGGIRNGSAAAYVTIANTGSESDTLTGAFSPACGTTELHEMVDIDGVRTMRATGSLPIPSAGSVQLKPGGTHIMLMHLKKSLRKNDSVDIMLHFARYGDITLRTQVR